MFFIFDHIFAINLPAWSAFWIIHSFYRLHQCKHHTSSILICRHEMKLRKSCICTAISISAATVATSRSLFVVLSEMFQQLLDRLILNVLQTVVFDHAEKSHNFIYHHHQVYLLFIILLANLPHLCISMYKYC